MSGQLTITLPDVVIEQLTIMANERHVPVVEVIQELVLDSVNQSFEEDSDDDIIASVSAAMADLRAGRVYSVEEMREQLRASDDH